MVGLESGAITPYRIYRLLALMRTLRVFSFLRCLVAPRVQARSAGPCATNQRRFAPSVRTRQLIDFAMFASFINKYGRQRRSNPSEQVPGLGVERPDTSGVIDVGRCKDAHPS